jgi:hypothetical protein
MKLLYDFFNVSLNAKLNFLSFKEIINILHKRLCILYTTHLNVLDFFN